MQLQRAACNILWWHKIQKGGSFRLPCDQTMKMLETLLRKGLDPNQVDETNSMLHGVSIFHYAASLNWHNACYLFVDYGADPVLNDVFGKGLNVAGHWQALPLHETERIHHCDEMVRRRNAFLEQQRRDEIWARRRHLIIALSGSGFFDVSSSSNDDTSCPLPPIMRQTPRENLDYLHGSVFANPLLRERVISFL